MQVVLLPQKPSVETTMPAGGWAGEVGWVGGDEGVLGALGVPGALGVLTGGGEATDVGGAWPEDSAAVPQRPKPVWQPKPQCWSVSPQ